MPCYTDVLALPNRPKIDVVLSSGGIKSCAAIELFDFLEQAAIPIDLLVGCSGGAMLAAYKAISMTIEEMRQNLQRFASYKSEILKIDYQTIGALLNIPLTHFTKGQGILKGEAFQKVMYEMLGDRRIEDLPIKTVIQVTDMETGLGKALTYGDLAKTVAASSSLVPLLPPVFLDGHWFVDGGYSTALPILQAVSRGIDIIIAIDFQSGVKNQNPTNYADYFYNFTLMSLRNAVHFQNSCAVDLHHYEIIFIEVAFEKDIALWAAESIPQIFEQGKLAVENAKKQIIEAIELYPLHLNTDGQDDEPKT